MLCNTLRLFLGAALGTALAQGGACSNPGRTPEPVGPLNVIDVDGGPRVLVVINGRRVLYPSPGVWDSTVKFTASGYIARYDGAALLAEAAMDQVPSVGELGTPGYVFTGLQTGDPLKRAGDYSPMMAEMVRLGSTGRIVDHLVSLLGDDRSLCFFVERTPWGAAWIRFDRTDRSGTYLLQGGSRASPPR